MIIGFATGNFYELIEKEEDSFSSLNINHFKASGLTNAIELHCPNEEIIDHLLQKEDLELSSFSYISVHVPSLINNKKEELKRILNKLRGLKEKYKIKNFVFHIEKEIDWSIFSDYLDLPVSIENMDNEKDSGKNIEDIEKILKNYPFNLTLDLQHCFTNDRSMKLAIDIQENFKERITEYHISGFEEEVLHYPLFKTNQNIIIESLLHKDIPIIIESCFKERGEEIKEIRYIVETIKLS
jgi:hypothetical protein